MKVLTTANLVVKNPITTNRSVFARERALVRNEQPLAAAGAGVATALPSGGQDEPKDGRDASTITTEMIVMITMAAINAQPSTLPRELRSTISIDFRKKWITVEKN